MNKPYILGIGASNMDVLARFERAPQMRDSNPALNKTAPGGVARNIMDNLARLGVDCVLLTAVGKDAYGQQIVSACENVGIDCSHVYYSDLFPTASYVAMHDETGDMFVAAADTRIIDNIPISYFEENEELIRNASAIVCDPNLNIEQIRKIYELAGGVDLYIDPTSKARASKLRGNLSMFHFIKPNCLELEELSGMPCRSDGEIAKASQELIRQGVGRIAVSMSDRGCYYADSEGNSVFRSLDLVCEMKSATGAGDAFMAGMIKASSEGLPTSECLDYAMACGAIAVMSSDTINSDMSDEYAKDLVRKYSRRW